MTEAPSVAVATVEKKTERCDENQIELTYRSIANDLAEDRVIEPITESKRRIKWTIYW